MTNAQSLPLQLKTNSSFAASFPFIVLIPQCPVECAEQNHWLPGTLQSVTALTRQWIFPHLGGDAARVYLAGQSMGGHGAWTYAAQEPHFFAAVVVVCGYAQGSTEARRVTDRLALAGTPVAVYHSADDSVIPVDASDQMVAALRARGYSSDQYADQDGGRRRGSSGPVQQLQLRYVRYDHAPGPPMAEFAHLTGHGSYELAFREASLYAWLLSHKCRTCTAPRSPRNKHGGEAEVGANPNGGSPSMTWSSLLSMRATTPGELRS